MKEKKTFDFELVQTGQGLLEEKKMDSKEDLTQDLMDHKSTEAIRHGWNAHEHYVMLCWLYFWSVTDNIFFRLANSLSTKIRLIWEIIWL